MMFDKRRFILFSIFVIFIYFAFKEREKRIELKHTNIRIIFSKNASVVTNKNFDIIAYESYFTQSKPFILLSYLTMQNNYLRIVHRNLKSKKINKYNYNFFGFKKGNIIRLLQSFCKMIGGGEDPRFFWKNEELYILIVDTIKKNNKYKVVQCIGKIDKKSGKINNYNILTIKNMKTNKCEKNWTPWCYNNKIYFSYMLNPHIILNLNEDTGICNKIIEQPFNTNFPKLSGGTPAILYNNYYIGIAHNIQDHGLLSKFNLHRVYNSYFYLFEKDYPFKLIFVSKPFTIKNKGCEFITGIKIDNNNVYLTIGISDIVTYVVKLNKNELDKLGLNKYLKKI
jgi:hypothetical protein